MTNFSEIRDNLTEEYIKQPRTPENKLFFDEALAVLDFAEATDLKPKQITSSIESLIQSQVGALLNMTFRLSGVTITSDTTLSRDLLSYISFTFKEELHKQAVKLFAHQLRQDHKGE